MPKRNTKRTQYKSFEEIFGDSLYELFHPGSEARLINYSDFNLVNVDELKLINTEDFNFVESRHLKVLHLPTIAFFIQYVGAFALTFALIFGLFFSYALMTTPGVSNAEQLAAKYIEENSVSNVAMETRQVESKPVYVANNYAKPVPGVRVIARAPESKPTEYVPFNEPVATKVEEEIANVESVSIGKVAGVSDQRGFVVVDQVEPEVEETEAAMEIDTVAPDIVQEINKYDEPVVEEVASISKQDHRIYDVYDIDENNSRVIAAANSVPRVLGAKIDTSDNEFASPACSFSFNDSKYSSGSELYLKATDEGAKVCVDYSSSAARSVAKLNSKIASENTDFVNCVDLDDLDGIEDLTVEVMDSNANYIGSCQLNIAVSTVRELASL